MNIHNIKLQKIKYQKKKILFNNLICMPYFITRAKQGITFQSCVCIYSSTLGMYVKGIISFDNLNPWCLQLQLSNHSLRFHHLLNNIKPVTIMLSLLIAPIPIQTQVSSNEEAPSPCLTRDIRSWVFMMHQIRLRAPGGYHCRRLWWPERREHFGKGVGIIGM